MESMEHVEQEVLELLQLTVVFYDDPELEGVVCAHCLEFDIGGQGGTRDEARADVQDAVILYVVTELEMAGDDEEVFRPAPAELWKLRDRETASLGVLRVRRARLPEGGDAEKPEVSDRAPAPRAWWARRGGPSTFQETLA